MLFSYCSFHLYFKVACFVILKKGSEMLPCYPCFQFPCFGHLCGVEQWYFSLADMFYISSVFHCLPLVACCDHICISILELLSVTIVFVFYDVIIRVEVISSLRRSGFL